PVLGVVRYEASRHSEREAGNSPTHCRLDFNLQGSVKKNPNSLTVICHGCMVKSSSFNRRDPVYNESRRYGGICTTVIRYAGVARGWGACFVMRRCYIEELV